jgi:hypothetical protein
MGAGNVARVCVRVRAWVRVRVSDKARVSVGARFIIRARVSIRARGSVRVRVRARASVRTSVRVRVRLGSYITYYKVTFVMFSNPTSNRSLTLILILQISINDNVNR